MNNFYEYILNYFFYVVLHFFNFIIQILIKFRSNSDYLKQQEKK